MWTLYVKCVIALALAVPQHVVGRLRSWSKLAWLALLMLLCASLFHLRPCAMLAAVHTHAYCACRLQYGCAYSCVRFEAVMCSGGTCCVSEA